MDGTGVRIAASPPLAESLVHQDTRRLLGTSTFQDGVSFFKRELGAVLWPGPCKRGMESW